MAQKEDVHEKGQTACRPCRLIPLKNDPERYKDVFLTGFLRIAQADVVFREITRIFDVELKERLVHSSKKSHEEIQMLGIGVGEGMYIINITHSIESLLNKYSTFKVHPYTMGKYSSTIHVW